MPLFRRTARVARPIVALTVVPLGNFSELRLVIDSAEPGVLEGRKLVLRLDAPGGAVVVRAWLSRRTNLEFDAGHATASLIVARAALGLTGWRAVVEGSRRSAPIAIGEGTIGQQTQELVA